MNRVLIAALWTGLLLSAATGCSFQRLVAWDDVPVGTLPTLTGVFGDGPGGTLDKAIVISGARLELVSQAELIVAGTPLADAFSLSRPDNTLLLTLSLPLRAQITAAGTVTGTLRLVTARGDALDLALTLDRGAQGPQGQPGPSGAPGATGEDSVVTAAAGGGLELVGTAVGLQAACADGQLLRRSGGAWVCSNTSTAPPYVVASGLSSANGVVSMAQVQSLSQLTVGAANATAVASSSLSANPTLSAENVGAGHVMAVTGGTGAVALRVVNNANGGEVIDAASHAPTVTTHQAELVETEVDYSRLMFRAQRSELNDDATTNGDSWTVAARYDPAGTRQMNFFYGHDGIGDDQLMLFGDGLPSGRDRWVHVRSGALQLGTNPFDGSAANGSIVLQTTGTGSISCNSVCGGHGLSCKAAWAPGFTTALCSDTISDLFVGFCFCCVSNPTSCP